MQADSLKSNGQVFELKLTAGNDADRQFLTRLLKAFLLDDKIFITGKNVLCYRSGADPEILENMKWEPQ